MKKNIKFTLIALLAVFGLAACDNNEYEYTGAPRTEGAQVYFPQENAAAVELSGLEGTFNVPISRVDTTKEATVTFTADATSANFTLPQQVAFAKGQKDAQLEIAYTGLEYDKVDTITIKLDSAFVTPYGVSEYKFTVKCPAPWTPWCNGKAQWVAAGQDPEAWPLGETTQTCTYTYNILFSGDDPGLPISYRCSTIDPTQAQFKIEHWASDVDLIIDYNPQTNDCQVAPQFAAEHPDYGPVTVSDIPHYKSEYNYESFPCKFFPETGVFGLNVVYYVSAGMFGNSVEYVVCDGYPDYSVALDFVGVLTDKNQKPFAQVMATFGTDATSVKAFLCTADDDANAVADAIAAGEVEAVDLMNGLNNLPINEELQGSLKVVAASIVNGEAREVAEVKFEYYGGGASPWKSLGIGIMCDDIILPFFTETGAYDSWEVEIQESTETPGMYRLVDPWGPGVNPYHEPLTNVGVSMPSSGKYLYVNAIDPEGVYVEYQSLGIDWGEGEAGFATEGAAILAEGYSFEDIKNAGLFGKVEKGIISFPGVPIYDENNQPTEDIDQGYIYLNGKPAYYTGRHGMFSITLPEAVTPAASAKARLAGRKMNMTKQNKAGKAVARKRYFGHLAPTASIVK